MWLVLALSDNLVIDYPPQKKAYYIINTLVLKVGGGNVDSNNIEYYYNKDGHELVRVRDSALRGAVILSDSEIWESGLHS